MPLLLSPALHADCMASMSGPFSASWTPRGLPRLPPFGTGLSPVLQWLLLPGLALYLTAGAGSEPGRKAARDP